MSDLISLYVSGLSIPIRWSELKKTTTFYFQETHFKYKDRQIKSKGIEKAIPC